MGVIQKIEVAGRGGQLDMEGPGETGLENSKGSGLNDQEVGNNVTVDCYN